MVPVYQENDFYEQKLSCTKCGWKGLGYDANIISFFGVTDSKEVHCPECDEKIAILQKGDRPPGESATDLSYQFG